MCEHFVDAAPAQLKTLERSGVEDISALIDMAPGSLPLLESLEPGGVLKLDSLKTLKLSEYS